MTEADFRYVASGASNVGLVRKVNEDALLDRTDLGLWVVADGMGGHSAGDVASGMIVEHLNRLQSAPPATLLNDVIAGLTEVDRLLFAEAHRDGAERVIGSTVVALLTARRHYACIWAGDSRLYLWRDGVLQQVTRDHSLVQDLIDRQMLRPEEAESHPQANVITRAIGVGGELELEVVRGQLRSGDTLLLCSDGLTKMLPDEEIAQVLGSLPFDQAAAGLIDLALRQGGKDNVTVLLVNCQDDAANGAMEEDEFGLPA